MKRELRREKEIQLSVIILTGWEGRKKILYGFTCATTAVKFIGAEQSRAWQGLRGRETRR